jgi:hypothetical protein
MVGRGEDVIVGRGVVVRVGVGDDVSVGVGIGEDVVVGVGDEVSVGVGIGEDVIVGVGDEVSVMSGVGEGVGTVVSWGETTVTYSERLKILKTERFRTDRLTVYEPGVIYTCSGFFEAFRLVLNHVPSPNDQFHREGKPPVELSENRTVSGAVP